MVSAFLTAAVPKKWFGDYTGSKLPLILNVGRRVTIFWQMPLLLKLMSSKAGTSVIENGSSWNTMQKIDSGKLPLSAFRSGTIGHALMIHTENGQLIKSQFKELKKFNVGSGAIKTIISNAAAHYYLLHEIGHVLTQYRKDQTSEGFLLAFTTKNQGFQPYFWWTSWIGDIVGTMKYGWHIHWQYQEARERAKLAKNIFFTDWSERLGDNIAEVRKEYNIPEPITYNTHSKIK